MVICYSSLSTLRYLLNLKSPRVLPKILLMVGKANSPIIYTYNVTKCDVIYKKYI